MDAKELVQLIGSGNTQAVSQTWSQLFESNSTPIDTLLPYGEVLSELVKRNEGARAEELAWEAIEALSAHHEAKALLPLAGRFLRASGDSETLRKQVVDLYRKAHAEREGLETLIEEAGLTGGRPVRRALRTMEVCLAISVGDYLVARDEDDAARVEHVDLPQGKITITGPEGEETLNVVHLADRYRPARATAFRVLRQFAPDQLLQRLETEPAEMVTDICIDHGGQLNSIALESLLVPQTFSESEWKKWWSKARTALTRCPHIELQGRSPYNITYVDKPVELEAGVLEAFTRQPGPIDKLKVVNQYLRECKSRQLVPSEPLLRSCYDQMLEGINRAPSRSAPSLGLHWAVVRKIGETLGVDRSPREAVDYFRDHADLGAVFSAITDDSLLLSAIDWVVEARPDDWTKPLLEHLAMFPLSVCDVVAARLIKAGRGAKDFEPFIQRVLASPVKHFEALLWLWDGPSIDAASPSGLVQVFSRILRALDEARRSDTVPKETVKRINARARAVLSARRYERFDLLLDKLEPGMAGTFRTQLRHQESLGRAVRQDLLRRLDRRFPPVSKQKQIPPWELDDVLYVTEAGFARKQDEIEHHVNVTMKKNAEAIGRAAERGDLSENSEYKFALEERDLLRARLAQMNSELAAAKVLDPADVPTDYVGIGTLVRFTRVSDHASYELAFVGPWEADLSKGWINYRAPLAKKVLGKKVGDRVLFDHSGAVGEYEIVSLVNLLEESEL